MLFQLDFGGLELKGCYFNIKRENTCYTEWKSFHTVIDLWLWKMNLKRYGWKVTNVDKTE